MEIYNGHDYTIYEKENEDFIERISYLEATYHAPFTFGTCIDKLNVKFTLRRPNFKEQYELWHVGRLRVNA